MDLKAVFTLNLLLCLSAAAAPFPPEQGTGGSKSKSGEYFSRKHCYALSLFSCSVWIFCWPWEWTGQSHGQQGCYTYCSIFLRWWLCYYRQKHHHMHWRGVGERASAMTNVNVQLVLGWLWNSWNYWERTSGLHWNKAQYSCNLCYYLQTWRPTCTHTCTHTPFADSARASSKPMGVTTRMRIQCVPGPLPFGQMSISFLSTEYPTSVLFLL